MEVSIPTASCSLTAVIVFNFTQNTTQPLPFLRFPLASPSSRPPLFSPHKLEPSYADNFNGPHKGYENTRFCCLMFSDIGQGGFKMNPFFFHYQQSMYFFPPLVLPSFFFFFAHTTTRISYFPLSPQSLFFELSPLRIVPSSLPCTGWELGPSTESVMIFGCTLKEACSITMQRKW
ncbi:unnamed protein product [Lactuca saligna]|uniref:Uncharacterized protein n=1 Tax=Lactuca saligna TaxID=75948 RepID=A0AA35W053_LACSI|nr:unnamed protein product [Lactuca saligna]